MHPQLLSFATAFIATYPGVPVDGEYYDCPDTTVYLTSTLKLGKKSRIEINAITPEAPHSFEWSYELTINDKDSDTFIHLLLQRDGNVVETYGKTVLPVNDQRAQEIYAILTRLTA